MTTQKVVAEHLDLSERRIRTLIKEGVLPASKGRGGLDLKACRISYIRNLRGVASGQVIGPAADEETINLDHERGLLTRKQAEKIQLFLDEEQGLLVRAEEVQEEWSKVIYNCRARLLLLPTKLASDCHAAGSMAEVQSIIKRGVYEALDELARTKGNFPKEDSEGAAAIREPENQESQ